MKSKKAFTLVEMMIVVLIIGILLAIAVPNFMKARNTSRTQACISNLTEISTAKEMVGMDLKLISTQTPTQAQMVPNYLKTWPTCPINGVYAINTMATNPTCTIAGHVMP